MPYAGTEFRFAGLEPPPIGGGFATREQALEHSAKGSPTSYVCWACGRSAAKAVPKRRHENSRWSWGMYHARCKARRDPRERVS